MPRNEGMPLFALTDAGDCTGIRYEHIPFTCPLKSFTRQFYMDEGMENFGRVGGLTGDTTRHRVHRYPFAICLHGCPGSCFTRADLQPWPAYLIEEQRQDLKVCSNKQTWLCDESS